jgi:hypothetical protein
MVWVRRAVPIGAAVALVLIVGCSDPYTGRYEVSGSATLKGQPMPDGAVITFIPQDNQKTEGQGVFSGGKYLIRRENGLEAGKYLVRMTAGDGKTAVSPTNPDEPPGPGGGNNIISKELVPKEWGVNSKQEVTVSADKPNVFDFIIP